MSRTQENIAGRNEARKGFLRNVAFAALAAGIMFRCWYIVWVHPLGDYLYSDMAIHAGKIKRLAGSWADLKELDFLNPVGYPLWSSLFYDESTGWAGITAVQLLMSCLLPILIGGIARRCHGERAGYLALILASLHFHLVDYFAYILSEGPFMFFMVSGVWLILRTTDRDIAPGTWTVRWHYLCAGMALGVACCMKVQIIIPLTLVMMAWLLIRRFRSGALHPGWRGWRPLLLIPGFLIPVLPVSVWGSLLSTRGPFLVSPYGPMNFLMGHYLEAKFVSFNTPTYHGGFGSPASFCRVMGPVVSLEIDPNDGRKLLAASFGWIREEPARAFAATLSNLRDIVWCPGAWPSIATSFHRVSSVAEAFFFLFILLPALSITASDLLRTLRAPQHVPKTWAWIATVAGIGLTVMVGVGEVRYRVPFDAFFIILASAFLSSPRRATSLPGSVAAPRDISWQWILAFTGIIGAAIALRFALLPGAPELSVNNILPTPAGTWLRGIDFPQSPAGRTFIPAESLVLAAIVPLLMLYATMQVAGRTVALAVLCLASMHLHLIEVFRFEGTDGLVLVANLVTFCLLALPVPGSLLAGLVSGMVFLLNPAVALGAAAGAALARVKGMRRYLAGFVAPWLLAPALMPSQGPRLVSYPTHLVPRLLMTLHWDDTSFSWKEADGTLTSVGNPYAMIKSEQRNRHFDHPVQDTPGNLLAIARKSADTPENIFTAPFMSARNMFWGQYLWPANVTARRHWLRIWEFAFHVTIVIPVMLKLFWMFVQARGWRERLAIPAGNLPVAFVIAAIVTGALFGGGVTHRVMFEFAFVIAGIKILYHSLRSGKPSSSPAT